MEAGLPEALAADLRNLPYIWICILHPSVAPVFSLGSPGFLFTHPDNPLLHGLATSEPSWHRQGGWGCEGERLKKNSAP